MLLIYEEENLLPDPLMDSGDIVATLAFLFHYINLAEHHLLILCG